MKRSLLVLGASYSQIPLFKAAGRLGVNSIAATIPGPYAGIPYADEVLYCDISKPDDVIAAVDSRSIDGVTTCCMDTGTKTMGRVCRQFSLPGPGIGAEAACDKYLQKELYARAGVRTAEFRKIHNQQELLHACRQIGFPVMLKAVDLMGSRGIFRADTPQEAELRFPQVMAATKKDYCIVEKFLTGDMFGIEAMVSHGSLVYVLPLGNDLHNGNPPFPQGHHVPWEKTGGMGSELFSFAEQVCKALEFDNCAVDMDCMLSGEKPWIIEATPRAGATAITDMVGIYYGIDYYEAIVRCALGDDVSDMFRTGRNIPNASWMIGSDKEGILEGVDIPKDLPEYVVDLSFNARAGDSVRLFSSGADRIGQLVVKGRSAVECRKEIDKVLGSIVIKVR